MILLLKTSLSLSDPSLPRAWAHRTGLSSLYNIRATWDTTLCIQGPTIQHCTVTTHCTKGAKIRSGPAPAPPHHCARARPGFTWRWKEEKDNGPKWMTAVHYHRLAEKGLFITASATYTQCNQQNVCHRIPTQKDATNFSLSKPRGQLGWAAVPVCLGQQILVCCSRKTNL